MPTVTINGAGSGSAVAGGTNPNSSRNSPALGVAASSSNAPASRMRAATQSTTNGSAPSAHVPPLSSLKSAALDLSTVERRGQPTEVQEPVVKKSRPWDLEEAPTYWPTEDEWRDPGEFMRKISPEAQKYGICKIIPPASWDPDFAIDTERFHFKTRKQELNSVEGSTRANLAYLDGLSKFHKQQGGNLHRLPYVDKKPLDLYKLKKCVETRGGFEKVCKHKKWAEIGRDLGYSGKIMSSLSTSLKNSYQKWLEPYEEYLKLAKPGVHQQLEYEYGGPLGTPSPSLTPMKKSGGVYTPPTAESPARHATDALQTTLQGHTNGTKDADRDTPMPDAAPPAAAASPAAIATPTPNACTTGFRAINSGGFTAVNSGFTSVNRTPKADTPAHNPTSAVTTAKNTPDMKHSTLVPASSLKRQLSNESLNSGTKDGEGDDVDEGGRRSKRVKKENAPTVAGSHMTLFRATGPRGPRDEWAGPGERCEQCGKGDQPNSFVTCESCDHVYHGTCLDPPVKQRPDSEWNCPRCLVGDGNFGFEDGGIYSLRQFQLKAAQFKQSYFENKLPMDSTNGCPRPVTEEDVEREFWRLVVDLEETVEVEYGADIHCTTHGSGFPTLEKNPNDPYATDPWNLNMLPLHGESLFKHIKSDVSGMTVPWVYVGMTFSTFCWHNEDHYSYSANYQHFGATKTWYGIPAEDAEKFEHAMREAVPELFETQPDLLFQLVTLLTPEHLKKAGVRVYALDQRAGQLVVTFPQAYHAGFNHGFNFNEAVNFAPSDWEPFGLAGVERLQLFRRQPCFSHDELLWTAAEGTSGGTSGGGLTIDTAKWLHPALERVHTREIQARADFMQRHMETKSHSCSHHGDPPATDKEGSDSESDCPMDWPLDEADLQEDEYGCGHCKAFAYLSRFKCLKTGMVLCLAHAGQHPCCDVPEADRYLGKGHAMMWRKSNEELLAMSARVQEKARMPETWEEKYDTLLQEEARPSLRLLRNLLHEGEKIPYELPSLGCLRQFVERCNEWVEEASYFTVRKQQNRRKSENRGHKKSNSSSDKRNGPRTVENIQRLIRDADRIGFDCPEIGYLQERSVAIEEFQRRVDLAVSTRNSWSPQEMQELLEEARGFNVDIPQIEQLDHLLEQLQWTEEARQKRGVFMTMEEVEPLLAEGKRLQIPAYNEHIKHYEEQLQQGRVWEKRAREIMSADVVHHGQLEALSTQVVSKQLPVSKETYNSVESVLHKHREAQKQVYDLLHRAENNNFRLRPKYLEMMAVMKKLEDLNSKPTGTLDLEREQKRHEDWMRRGKKLFGKTNAPLHILKSHMEYVLERNTECFDTLRDKPRHPAEPSSRANSPETDEQPEKSDREVFCICRKPEAGLMIECEQCHEWYHSRCLKIARGKIKEEDKYTCPICDWRVKIPRDATRPKVEDLMEWQDEIMKLPFQPEEEEVLNDIIENALEFRRHVLPYMTVVDPTPIESETQRFFLRKIEGAEILLAAETNHLRQVLHRYYGVVAEAPPLRDISLSTRKPRPTKLQKLLAEHKVENIDDLPDDARLRAQNLRRKQMNHDSMAGTNPMLSNGHSGHDSRLSSANTSPTYGRHFFGFGASSPHTLNTDVQRKYSQSLHSASGSEVSSIKDTPTRMNSNSNIMMVHPALLGDGLASGGSLGTPFDDFRGSGKSSAATARPDWEWSTRQDQADDEGEAGNMLTDFANGDEDMDMGDNGRSEQQNPHGRP